MILENRDHETAQSRELENFEEYSPSMASDGTKAQPSTSSFKESYVEVSFVEDGLPPVDGGIRAWLFLLACAMLEALVWGEFCVRN